MRLSVRNSKGIRWLAVASLTIPLAVFSTSSAQAEDGPFNINGTVPDASATEYTDTFGNVKELGPLNSSTTKIGVIHNDPVPTLGLTNPNAQVDLRRAWLDQARDANDHDWLYFGWERDSNSGSGFIAYEFLHKAPPTACDYDALDATLISSCNPWKGRQGATQQDPTAGDFMILWDQQGGSRDLYLRTWRGTAPNLTLSAPELLNGSVSAAAYGNNGFRGEAAVDLTATIYNNTPGCQTIASAIPSTVTGNSDSADYKDTILKNIEPLTNCGVVTVEKVTDPAGDTDTQFAWEMRRANGSALKFDGTTTVSDTIKSGAANIDEVSDLKAGTNYTLTETDEAGPAYRLKSIVCTDEGGNTYSGAAFTVVAGETTACVITNELQKGTLIVNKFVTNDNGGTALAGSFTFRVNGAAAANFSQLADPLKGSNSMSVDQGNYTVVEPTVNGYTTTYTNNTNTNTNCTNLFVPAGGSATCNIYNDDTKASPTGTTTQSWVLHDRLNFSGLRSGAPNASTATATFRLYSDATCSALVNSEQDSSISAGVASTTSGIAVTATGDYYWRVHYSGDSYNEGFTTACGDEISQIRAKDAARENLITVN